MSATSLSAEDERRLRQMLAGHDPLNMEDVRQLCFHGIPDDLRPMLWRLLLALLPPNPNEWHARLEESRVSYYTFVRDLIVDVCVPEDIRDDKETPLYAASNSAFLTYHRDSAMLEQIIKDIRRTWTDSDFIKQSVPPSTGCPLTQPYDPANAQCPCLPRGKSPKQVAPDTSGVPPTPLRRSRTLRDGLPPPSPLSATPPVSSFHHHRTSSLRSPPSSTSVLPDPISAASISNGATLPRPPRRSSSVSMTTAPSFPRRRSSLSGSALLSHTIPPKNDIISPPRPVFSIADNEDDEETRSNLSGGSKGAPNSPPPPLPEPTPRPPKLREKRTPVPFPSLSIKTGATIQPSLRRVPSTPRRVSSLGLPFTLPTSEHTVKAQKQHRLDFWNRVRHLADVSNKPPDDWTWRPDRHHEVLERILFLYAKLNPGIGYVQGMNELVVPIYYVFARDMDPVARAHAEPDAFFCFTVLMSSARDNFLKTMDGDNSTGINASMKRLEKKLQRRDPELWLDLEVKSVRPMYYAFRWITVMCSQDWPLFSVLRLWDAIFSDPPYGVSGEGYTSADSLEFLLDFCCAMLM